MNAERLHEVVIALRQELSATQILTKLETLCGAVEEFANNPDPSHQEALAGSLAAVRSALDSNASDNFCPAWRRVMSDLQCEGLFGASLKANIDYLVQGHQGNWTVAGKELREGLNRVQAFKTAAEQLNSAFCHFYIGLTDASDVILPRVKGDNKFVEFAEELKEIAGILNTLSEVAAGKPNDLALKICSSKNNTVDLAGGDPFEACLTFVISRIFEINSRLQRNRI